jgi:hypothetical protein
MKRMKSLVVLATVLCSAAPVANAQGPDPGGRGLDLDANGDGVVSASEFEKVGRQRFQRMDENHDGLIDRAEIVLIRQRIADRMKDRGPRPAVAGKRPDMIAGMDTDKDGEITLAEVTAAQKARFKKADKNGDGMLDEAEQKALRPGGGPRPR